MGFQKCPDGIHCNFSGFLLGKTEHTCGNTAESDALHAALHRKFQTALIAAFQQFAVLFGQPALHDWSDGVYHIVAWQIVGRRDFRCTCRFFMPLCFHDLRTFQPQANPCKGMDTVINTIMYNISNALAGVSGAVAAVLMYLFQSVFNFFVVSGTGQAAITMPIMAPLSDLLGVSRQTAVVAFQLGDAFTNLIVPTSGCLIGSLAIAKIEWSNWIKFMWKFLGVLMIGAIITILIAVGIGF